MLWGTEKMLQIHANKSAPDTQRLPSTPAGSAGAALQVLWEPFDCRSHSSPPHTTQAHSHHEDTTASYITRCHPPPEFPQISPANNNWFPCTFTSEQLEITQGKIVSKSEQREGGHPVLLRVCSPGPTSQLSWGIRGAALLFCCSATSWGISLLGYLNITSQLSVLFCTHALPQINFRAGEFPS